MGCVNIKHKDFIELQEKSGLSSLVLEMRVSQWQKLNNTEDFPSINEINRSFKGVMYQKDINDLPNDIEVLLPELSKVTDNVNILNNIKQSFEKDEFARGVLIGERESQKKYLLKYLDNNQSAADFILEYAKEYDFLGDSLDNLFLHLQANLLTSNKNYLGLLSKLNEKANEKLDNQLTTFLRDKFKADVVLDFKNHPGGIRAAADILNKQVTLFKEGKLDTLAEETSHFFFELLSKDNPVYIKLMSSVETWVGYKSIYDSYKNTYLDNEGNTDVNKVKREAIAQAISQGIVRNFKSEEGEGFFKHLQSILDTIKELLEKFDLFSFEVEVDNIAKDILKNDISLITNQYNSEGFKKQRSDTLLSRFPQVKAILDSVKKLSGVIVGSLSYRDQGDLFRPDSEELHDLDIEVPWSAYQGNIKAFFEKLEKEIPNFKYVLSSNGEVVTWNDIKNQSVNYQITIDDLSADLFFKYENSEERQPEGKDWIDAFRAKFNYKRPKDQFDILNWDNFTKKRVNDNNSVFFQKNNIKSGVDFVFEQNPELANAVYEALGFEKPMSDQTIKTEEDLKFQRFGAWNYFKENPSDPWGQSYFSENLQDINLNDIITYETPKEDKLQKMGDFQERTPKDKFDTTFPVGIKLRNKIHLFDGHHRVELAKRKGLTTIKMAVKDVTEKYAQITPQQKQQAKQLYQQYLESLNKLNTNPILQNNQQEQVKKFAELQERLNNKEFLEGAKNAYENSEGLKSFGTQEQYNDYIARVSLGIIKNPSSGDYNYTSKVKDIVYHFSNTKIDKPNKEKFSLSANINRRKGFFGIDKNVNPGNNFANVEGTIPHAMLFNMKNPDFGDFSVLPPIVAKDETRDSAIIKQRGNINYYVVFEPEQIHILSSKADIQGFKDFMSFENSEFSKYGTYQQFTEFITSKSSIEIENKLIETGKIDRVC